MTNGVDDCSRGQYSTALASQVLGEVHAEAARKELDERLPSIMKQCGSRAHDAAALTSALRRMRSVPGHIDASRRHRLSVWKGEQQGTAAAQSELRAALNVMHGVAQVIEQVLQPYRVSAGIVSSDVSDSNVMQPPTTTTTPTTTTSAGRSAWKRTRADASEAQQDVSRH